MLEKIPAYRMCRDVDIPNIYCSCVDFVEIDLNRAEKMKEIESLIESGVDLINKAVKNKSFDNKCKEISFKRLVRAEEKLLKHIEFGGNKKYKLAISINESQTTNYELFGYSVTEEHSLKFLKDNQSGLFPIMNYTMIINDKPIPMKFQVQNIHKIDSDAVCKLISQESFVNSDYCECDYEEIRKNHRFVGQIIKKFSFGLAENQTCGLSCKSMNRNCYESGLVLINDEKLLREHLKTFGIMFRNTTEFYEIHNVIHKIKGDFLGIRINHGSNDLILGENKHLDCEASDKTVLSLCPCL